MLENDSRKDILTEAAIKQLTKVSPKHGGDAFTLMSMLRIAYPDSHFTLNQVAYAADEFIPGWIIERYNNAKKVLLKTGMMTVVSNRNGRIGTVYKLSPVFLIRDGVVKLMASE